MEIVIVVLLIIISIFACYLFFIKREIENISAKIKEIIYSDSNENLHLNIPFYSFGELVNSVNLLIKEKKDERIKCDRKDNRTKKLMRNISHDLRTPLTSALGYIDILINNTEVNTDINTYQLKIIENRLLRLEELINSFFTFSKIFSDDNSNLINEEINVISVLEEAIVHYYDDYKNSNRKIILNNNIKKYKMFLNKEMLICIFDNLIGNAYKHSDSNLTVLVENDESFKVTFSNELLSDELDISGIFDEFYTLDISRTKGNTGLGLAISKEFTEKLGGIIYAKKTNNMLNIIIEFDYTV